METLAAFTKEFSFLRYALKKADRVLIVGHTRPDPDAVGSMIALSSYLGDNYKHLHITMGCYSPFPPFLRSLFPEALFIDLNHHDFSQYDIAIGCDSVDRGFDQVVAKVSDQCVTVAFDHHHDIALETDIAMIDPGYAATTELLYKFFLYDHGRISHHCATALLTGIMGDTGLFQHANTSPHVLSVTAELVRRGASISRISEHAFIHQKTETLNLWGKALERTHFWEESGVAITALTSEDLQGTQPSNEEIKEVATILANAPSVKVALILFQVSQDTIKASLRAKSDAGIDVSDIAHGFGGGGHPLAAGFEVPGILKAHTDGTWSVA